MKYIYILVLIIGLGILLYLNNNKLETFMSENTIPAKVHIETVRGIDIPNKSSIPDSIPTSSKFPRFTKLLNEMIPIMKNLAPILQKQGNDITTYINSAENAYRTNKLDEAKQYLEQATKNLTKLKVILKDLLTYKEEIYDLLYSIEESVQDTNDLVE
jgi:hypothetical protein